MASVVWPTPFLLNVFTAFKGTYFYKLFAITAAMVVPCGGPKKAPLTSSRLYNYRRWLEARNFGYRDCTIHVAKTKAMISFTVTAKLICVFVFAYAKRRFSHNEAHFIYKTK